MKSTFHKPAGMLGMCVQLHSTQLYRCTVRDSLQDQDQVLGRPGLTRLSSDLELGQEGRDASGSDAITQK